MNDRAETFSALNRVSQARIKRAAARFPVVWLVPLLGVIVAGYVVYDRVREFGPKITITFDDGSGVVSGQTPIQYRGVSVGEVTSVELSKDLKHAEVHARLHRSAASIARKGAIFWILRPEVGIGSITGLQTVLTGPEIHAFPGTGAPAYKFAGLKTAPPGQEPDALQIVLRARNPSHLRPNSPIYYRGVKVGAVQGIDLGRDATFVDIHAFITRRYANLVHKGSKFWRIRGFDLHAGLFRGIQLKMDSLTSLLIGGIQFATPSASPESRATEGDVFTLHEDAQSEWLTWTPRIRLAADS